MTHYRSFFMAGALVMAGAAQSAAADPVTVGVDNFIRAESDMYAASMVKEGALGKFLHRLIPPFGLLSERLEDDVVEIAAQRFGIRDSGFGIVR